MKEQRVKGTGILVLATFLFGMYGIYARLIGQGFEIFAQNWIRNLFVMSLAIIGVFGIKGWSTPKKKDILPIAGWAICDIGITLSIFLSFNHLFIGTALFLIYAGTTITGYIIGTVFLKEKLTLIKLLALLFCLIGLFTIFGFSLKNTQLFYVFVALGGGILGGIWNIFPKFISSHYSSFELIVFDAGAIFITNLPLAFIFHQPIPHISISLPWLGLVLYGITQLIGDQLMVHGFRKVEAHLGSVITPLEIVFGSVFGFLFFKETLTIASFIGGSFIFLGAILPHLFSKDV